MTLDLPQEVLIHRITNKIRQSLELQKILTTTTAEIRAFLKTDRVVIYRFHPDESGEVIAESIGENSLPSLLGLNFPADDIPAETRKRIIKTRQRAIINVQKKMTGISILESLETGESISKIEINYRPADPCHLEYLIAMGVQFSLSVPIFDGENLWGLLVSHHGENREITTGELEFIQTVADQVSLAIAQANILSLARSKAQREATINKIGTLLHDQPTIELQNALEEIVLVFQSCGGRIYILSQDKHLAEIYTCGQQPDLINGKNNCLIPLEEHPEWLEIFSAKNEDNINHNNIYALTDLEQELHAKNLILALKGNNIKGMLVVNINYRHKHLGYLTIFRDKINIEKIWAGEFNPDERQTRPRKSFEAWKELKQGAAKGWTEAEIAMAQALGNQFSMAIEQYKLYQQVQQINNKLQQQFDARTIELEKSLEQAKLMKQVTDQIRSTLNLEIILKTIVTEVRKLLNTDRVLIYKVMRNWQREVVTEDVKNSKQSLIGLSLEDYFSEMYVPMYEWSSYQAINNVKTAELTTKHRKFLNQIEVKAKLVVPIRMGEKLWGLLIAHECEKSREWQLTEIDLLQQLAIEASIAIQQAELYKQTVVNATKAQEQAQKLALAAEQQKTLFTVISKIRESLDLETIFQATVKEVRKLLNADRVGIYRFYPDSNCSEGEFLSEDVLPGFSSVLGMKMTDHCFAEVSPEYLMGKIWIMNDIEQANLSDCHINILQKINIKSNLVVPLIEGNELWGLLCSHQCEVSREWQSSEIEFVTQIAAHLGVALQQSELLAQTQLQTQKLSVTLEDLKATQSQLIQNEKMSSLGQLVAGIAHEINNPVNFIYGNVNYIEEYAQNLLELIEMYQETYPKATAKIEQKQEDIDLDFIKTDLLKMLKSMKVGTERIRQIVLSLRNFSRLDQADRKPVNIHDGIDSTLLILQHRLKSKDSRPVIKIVKNYAQLPEVECYPGQINQVFMNILSNGIDALESKYEESQNKQLELIMTITTKLTKNNHIVVLINDNGNGIPPEIKSKIFNPFFTTKPVGKGTGLGLSISYQIVVERHGGIFKCKSQPGTGTEFYIEIPVTLADV